MEHRKEKRFSSYAKVILKGQDKLGYLRDLNRLGCQIDFLEAPDLAVDEEIKIRVIPGEELDFAPLDLVLIVRWTKRDSELFSSIGGSLSEVSEEDQVSYERLLSAFAE